MKFKFVVTLCFIVGIAYGSDVTTDATPVTEAPTTQKTEPTTKPSPSTTSSPSTTIPPSTTASTTTTTTVAPTTSPSPSPTTSTPTNSSTTTSPTTTAEPPSPSTTPAPAPKMWIVKDLKTNVTCILAQMEVELMVSEDKKAEDTIKINPGNSEAVGGHCGSTIQTLRIVWFKNNRTSSMELSFNKTKTNYHISGANLTLYHNSSKGEVLSMFSAKNLDLYETNLNNSYSCAYVELPPMDNDKNETVTIKVSDLLIEAFRPQNTTTFSASHYCSGEVPDIVPLVVGIALAALVLVVVIAYLIGRRRSQARGYLSM